MDENSDNLAIDKEVIKTWAKELGWSFLKSLIPVITGMILITAINFRLDVSALADEYNYALLHCKDNAISSAFANFTRNVTAEQICEATTCQQPVIYAIKSSAEEL